MVAVAPWVSAAATVASAVIYLFDFATNLITLRAYYRYDYECPHAALTSALLNDPFCHAIRSGFKLHNFRGFFLSALMFLLVAHLTYAIIFRLSLHRSQHPLRLAYFLPLIHLHRLLKLLLHSFSSNRLKELQNSQKEFSSLYNALGIALETTSQFTLQLIVALNFGQYIEGSSDPSEQAQKIPTYAILSLVTSSISCTYGTTMAVFFLINNRMCFSKRALISISLGIQAFAAMLAKGVNIASLFQLTSLRPPIPIMLIITIEFITSWIFSYTVIQSHYNHYQDRRGKSAWLRIAHSLGLALMIRVTGPMYVLIKLGMSSRFLLWGTILHILVELFGPAFVLFWRLGITSPCRTSHKASIKCQGNKYLTCKVFLGITFSSYLVFILTTLLVIRIHTKKDGSPSLLPESSRGLSHKNHNMYTFKSIISKLASNKSNKGIHQLGISSIFDYFVFLLTILCIQMLQRKTQGIIKSTFNFVRQ